ncbi:MAG: KEOPS complex subunit Cgi121 [Thermofilaceae archaeon]
MCRISTVAPRDLVPHPIDGGRAYALAFEVYCEEGIAKLLSMSEATPGLRIILFNPDAVVGPVHVITAVDYAVTSFRLGLNTARSLHIEAFLYAAATREISKALELFQPDANEKRAVAVLVADSAEACIKGVVALCERVKASISPIGYSEKAARLLAQKLRIEEKEIRATYSTDFASAVEKCLLSRMALEFLSR